MLKPYFSVIIPTLNEEKFLPHLLKSLLEQTYKDFEVIVVDGGSRDKTQEVARAFIGKLKLTIIDSKQANQSAQRNEGAAVAQGNIYVFVDADSYLYPYCLERVQTAIGRGDTSFLTAWFGPDGTQAGDAIYALIGNLYIVGSLIFHRELAPGPFTIVARELFHRIGGYDAKITWGEDYDLTQRIRKVDVSLTIIPETLFVYSLRRIRKQGMMSFLKVYASASLLVLLTKRNFRQMPGYIMGGHLYGKKTTKRQRSLLVAAERKIKRLIKELFE